MTAFGTEAGLVGRDRELAVVMEAVSRARSGRPTSMIVEGEAGLGKSRLVGEATRRLQVGGMPSVVVATGHGTDVTGDRIPYGVASSILNDLLPHVGPTWPSSVAPRLRSALATLHPAWGSHSAGAPLDRLALVAGFRQLLADLGTTSLVCLVIDDLHWADESSLDLMSLLARGPATPLLLLAAVRPISGEGLGVARHVADLSRRPDGELLTLRPLEEEAVQRYLSAADDGSWGPGTRNRIAVLAQGVPLFLEALSAGADRVGHALPPTIAALVAARLQTMAPQTRLVLEAAAVRELPVDRRALMAVTGLDEAALATGLQEACAHHLLDPLGGGRYRLHHPLVRRAIEESVVEQTSEQWHHGWATWLAGQAEVDATAYASLAHHWFHAGDAEHAITAALDAARAATELDATAEASLHWSRMLELWPVVADPRRSTGLDRDELIWSYYWALRASGNVEASQDLVARELALRPPVSGPKLLWLEARRYLESIQGGPDYSAAATGALTWEELLDLVRGVLGGSESPRPSCWMLGTLGTLLNRALPSDVMTLVAEWLDAMGDECAATAFLHAPTLQVQVYRLVRERRHEDALALARAAEVKLTAIGPNQRIRATANVAGWPS